MRRRPPKSTRTDTLFPYTTLFRSPLRRGGRPARRPQSDQHRRRDGDHRPQPRPDPTARHRPDQRLRGLSAGAAGPEAGRPDHLVLRDALMNHYEYDEEASAAWRMDVVHEVDDSHTPVSRWVDARSAERRVGTECVSTFRSRGSTAHKKKKTRKDTKTKN